MKIQEQAHEERERREAQRIEKAEAKREFEKLAIDKADYSRRTGLYPCGCGQLVPLAAMSTTHTHTT